MKHLHSLLTTAIIANSALTYADGSAHTNNPKMPEKSALPADDQYNPFLKQGFFITADFLYWIAHEEGLEYATTGLAGPTNDFESLPTALGSASKMHFKWKPGFRLGLGWTLPDSYWDLSLNWTWYHSRAKSSAIHEGDTDLNPLSPSLLSANLTEQSLDNASAKWRLSYNTLDFELGRSFYPNKHLALRPHAGVRGAWINQRYSNLYTFSFQDLQAISITTRELHNNYHSAGFKTGIDSLWSFNNYWGIFANSSLSLLGGNFHVREVDLPLFNGTGTSATNVRDRIFSVVPVLEAAMGLHLSLGPRDKRYRFDLNAGWEYLVWFNQNQMALFTSSGGAMGIFIRERANLHLMGFTLNAKFHF